MHAVLERVLDQIAAEISALDAQTTQLHPRSLTYKWNTQQVCEHLMRGYRQTSTALESRLLKGHAQRKQTRTLLQWSLQMMTLSFGTFPRGVPALDEALPVAGEFATMDGRQLIASLRKEMEHMDALLDRCRSKFGMDCVATHPWLGSLRVDQWRRFHALHGLHHVTQLRAVIADVAPAKVPLRMPTPSLVPASTLAKELQVPVQRPFA